MLLPKIALNPVASLSLSGLNDRTFSICIYSGRYRPDNICAKHLLEISVQSVRYPCLSPIPIVERLSLSRARLSTRRGYSRTSQISRSRSERDTHGGFKSTGIGRLSAHYANIQLAACPRYIAIVPFLRGPSVSSHTCAWGSRNIPVFGRLLSSYRLFDRPSLWGILCERNLARE